MGKAGLSLPNEENIVKRLAISGKVLVKERILGVEYLIFLPVKMVNVSETYNSICWRVA